MTTLQTMQAIFHTNFGLGPERLAPEANLEDLEIDSLSMIEVLFAVEDEFRITVPPQPAAWRSETRTVGDLVNFVDGLILAQRPVLVAAEGSA
jgi:acyl carrier protein